MLERRDNYCPMYPSRGAHPFLLELTSILDVVLFGSFTLVMLPGVDAVTGEHVPEPTHWKERVAVTLNLLTSR
jgi:hypothetical protein